MNLEQLLEAMDDVAAEPPRTIKVKGSTKTHTFNIREITIGEIDQQIEDNKDQKNKRGVARGACRLLCDEDGKQLLDPDNPEHVSKMAKLPLRVLTAINAAAELDKAPEPGN